MHLTDLSWPTYLLRQPRISLDFDLFPIQHHMSADAAAVNQIGVLLQRPAGETRPLWLTEEGICQVTTPVALQVAHIGWYQFIPGETRRK